MKRPVALLLAALGLSPAGALAFGPRDLALPLPAPPRGFLLLDAERRALPQADARVRVQLRGGGGIDLSVFRLHDPAAWIARAGDPDGLAVSDTPTGRAAEALLAQDTAMPRAGDGLTLVRTLHRTLTAEAPLRTGPDETAAYDRNEADEGAVETRWVRAGRWGDTRVPVGPLPAGLYLVRAHVGAYAANALLSVSDLTLLVRRGDLHDTVAVTAPDGRPRPRISVQVWEDGALRATAVTDTRGEARLPPSTAPLRRFVARDGDAWAWAEARHARFAPCDPRVYLDTGRPVFRPGETVHLRGHVRGCDADREAPMADRTVRLFDRDDEPVAEARTDRAGDFLATFTARSTALRAELDGRDHVRTIVLDPRRPPQRALRLTLDRAWAVPGETVTARAEDETGAWPRASSVTFVWGTRRVEVPIGPGRPAVARFVVPPTDTPLQRAVLSATLTEGRTQTLVQTGLWVGRSHRVVRLETVGTLGTPDGHTQARLRAEDLGGTAQSARLAVAVYGSDGNRPVGPARWRSTVETTPDHDPPVVLNTPGAGPWWVHARLEGPHAAEATAVLWDRPRTPSLGPAGALRVRAALGEITAGATLPVELVRPTGGATWVTLEQSGVWSSAWVTADTRAMGNAWRAALAVPAEARGEATVVATHLRGGEVTTATAVTRVEAAPAVFLRVDPALRVAPAGASLRVTLSATSPDGTARAGVASVWMADAGYWEMAEDTHPSPDAILALPGRPASAADSARPVAFGADEGRFLDPLVRFNDTPLARVTPFDLWDAGGAVVSLRASGGLDAIARAIALRAGLRGADVCPGPRAEHGTIALEARDMPWDLLAHRVAERTGTHAWIEGETLRLGCTPGPVRAEGGSLGSGSGSGSGYGAGGLGMARTEEMLGDLFFAGRVVLGPDGRAAVDIPMPNRAGRWRVQALVVATDGRGDRAHAVVTTAAPGYRAGP